MGKRYQRGKLEDVIKEWLIIQWSKDTKGEIRRKVIKYNGQKIKKGKLEDVIKEWLIIQWSKDTKREIRRPNQRMTDNTMVKRYQRGN